jgi:hypothetical protein
MTKDEALRIALEAMEMFCEHGAILRPIETRDAIKAALEAKDEPLTENGMYRLGYHNGYGFGEAYGKANAPQRKPLTDEEIEDAWASCEPDWDDKVNVITLARAIEAAHGIKGEAK